jgi:hypothetical protein
VKFWRLEGGRFSFKEREGAGVCGRERWRDRAYVIKFKSFGLKNGGGKDAIKKTWQSVLAGLVPHQQHLVRTEFYLRMFPITPKNHNSGIVFGSFTQKNRPMALKEATLSWHGIDSISEKVF